MESRRQEPHNACRSQNPDERNPRHDRQQCREGGTRQFPRILLRFQCVVFGEDGNKRGGHRALGKELTEQIRDPIGDKKRIGRRSRPKESCDDHVADKPEDTAGKGRDADHPS